MDEAAGTEILVLTIAARFTYGRLLPSQLIWRIQMSQVTKGRDETEFVLADKKVTLPNVSAGSAVKKAARRFEAAYELPAGAAFAFAAASVDPTAERGKVPSQNPKDHLTLIRTPSDQFLACHRARLWSPSVSGDGSNGRSRYAIQTEGDGSTRPWPIARHHRPAIVDYHVEGLGDMAAAVKASAEEIRSPKLVTEISQHERGVWNPPVVVLARAYVRGSNGKREERWFLHTIDGSTRIEACHELTEIDPAEPLLRSDDRLDYLRQTREEMAERFDTLPTSPDSLGAARAATVPALVVVGLVDEEGTPIFDGFPDVVNSYVESVHVQPRPFSDVAMNNVLGERLLLTLRREGLIDPETTDKLMGRSAKPGGKPSVRAAELVHLICDSRHEHFVREIAVTEERGRLTKNRRANLIGPLVVRQFKEPAETADRALMRQFTPDALIEKDWKVTGATAADLRKRAVGKFQRGEYEDPAILELVARGGPALCAAGLLLSDQGSTVEGKAELRGAVSKVLEGLIRSLGGIELLADAVAWADGSRTHLPRQRKPDGTVKTNSQGDELHYVAAWNQGNMQIRALALNNGVVPRTKKGGGEEEGGPWSTPEEEFKHTEEEMLEALDVVDTKFHDLLAIKDEQGRRLIDRIGLTPSDLVEPLTRKLSAAYARFSDDPLADLDDDLIPDAEVTLEAEEQE